MSTREALRLASIAQIHGLIGRPPPAHPLLSVIAASWQEPLRIPVPILGRAIESGLYVLSLKRGDECHVEFGRQVHDGQAGSIVFASPGQTITPIGGQSELTHEGEGWTVVFHPDLLRDGPLAAAMHQYRFFGYAAREALHLTDAEREAFTGLVRQIELESSVPPDSFAPVVLTAQLQLLLTYCQRAYARQFELRAKAGGVVAERLDRHLDEHLASAAQPGRGLPTVRSCARALGYSPDYLSDLLRAETGTSARTRIHRAVIEAAKARLLASAASTSEVAYALGFEHPQHFSRLFREKTGMSPGEWRRAAGTPGAVTGTSCTRKGGRSQR
ncbi:helix-turn-helix transcriptional regulator [Sorangium sp. So ce1078]|uniref:helix-turn-helix transcriptional regulator n=1 Tax=Sorangium sp. So ce1078 TaxID=3133329 RepID=UPI003F63C09D